MSSPAGSPSDEPTSGDTGLPTDPSSPTESSPPDDRSPPKTRSPADAPASPAPPSHDLEAALDRLRVERRILSDERSAFRAFADRLLATEGSVRTATIESHYRETVMAVPHYDSEYGDAFRDSVAAEFGSILAVDCRREERVGDATVDALREAAERCRASRDRVVDRIDVERHAIEGAAETLDAIVDRLETLDRTVDGATRLRLTRLRERCDDVARDRRDHLRSSRRTDDEAAIAQSELQSLWYHELPTDRPVLAAVEALRHAIERRRQDALGRRRALR